LSSIEVAKLRPSLLLLLPLFLYACGAEEEPAADDLTPADVYLNDPVALERGRAIYEGSCANFCHEVETDNDAVDLFDCEWRHGHTAEDLFEIIARGIADTRMVGFGENFPQGEEDTWRLVAYMLANESGCEEMQAEQPEQQE